MSLGEQARFEVAGNRYLSPTGENFLEIAGRCLDAIDLCVWEKLLDLLFLGGAQCHRHGYRWLIDIAPVLEFVEVAFEGQGDSAHLIIGLGETDRPYPCRSYRSAGTHVVFIGDNSVNQRFPVRGHEGEFHSQILGQFLYDIDVEPLVTVARRVTDGHWVPVAGRTNSQFA